MPTNITFKLVITEDGNEVFSTPLTYEAVGSIVGAYPKSEGYQEFLRLAAHHSSSSVREQVAYRENISDETVHALAKDPCLQVVSNLVDNNAFKKCADKELIQEIVRRDIGLARSIAGNLDGFENYEVSELASLLMESNDPSVLYALASNYRTPKKILKLLMVHADPYVAAQATETFENN